MLDCYVVFIGLIKYLSYCFPKKLNIIITIVGCQLLLNDTRIYCYSGGYAKTVNLDITPLPDHYYLDVSKDFTVSNTYNSWTRVVDPPNFVTEATFGYVSVKFSDTSVLLNGGTGNNDGKSYMKNQTVIYHADQNQWETISNTTSFPQRYVIFT